MVMEFPPLNFLRTARRFWMEVMMEKPGYGTLREMSRFANGRPKKPKRNSD